MESGGEDASRREYEERAEQFEKKRLVHARRLRRIGDARAVSFVGAIASVLWHEWAATAGALPLLAAAAFAALFVVFLRWHGQERRRERWYGALRDVNRESLARLDRRWNALPSGGGGGVGAEHAYAADLDIFGHASLFRLVNLGGTPAGTMTLERWLLSPASPEAVGERQAAVGELAGELELREELSVRARLVEDARPEQLETFLRWAEGPPAVVASPLLVWATRLIPIATVVLFLLHLSGTIGAAYWLIPLLIGLVLSRLFKNRFEEVYRGAFPQQGFFRHYPHIFRLLRTASFRSPALRRIQEELNAGGAPADRRMRRLERLMEMADARFSAFSHFPLQLITLWDFHITFALEQWRRSARGAPRRWFRALGEAEALCALAGLAHAHPHWVFPEIQAGPQEPMLQATSLGHPLLADQARVDNDVELGPQGTFLLVTGSNMSGKSTLLRAIGTNVVLAQAGGPVCARELRLPPLELYTSMRVQDSLAEGVSHFMAELKRLKQVVDAARSVATSADRTLLYLLDEILQGTNTAERQIAARKLIAHLLAEGAIGAISTHDLNLADSDALASAVRAVHLRETVHAADVGPAMTFDYRLRPGIATSTNALRLMEIVGLGVP